MSSRTSHDRSHDRPSRADPPGRARVGTSGWIYKHWRGTVYPRRLAVKDWFAFYAGRFDTVEVNNSFYRLPSEAAFLEWKAQAPPGFLYAIKASRYLTHLKKLKDPEQPLANVLDRARLLGPHLGPVLYQLPPRWRCDPDRLRAFLALLPPDLTHVMEFRDRSWYADAVRDLLAEHGVGFCVHDLGGEPSPEWVTARVVYVRFHGPTARAYAGGYPPGRLRSWADWMGEQRRAGHDVFAYFNNDDAGHAVRDAQVLRDMLGERDGGGRPVNRGGRTGRAGPTGPPGGRN
ncbi:MAG TPA: DUF72 domain-containing protein [Gemmataceae bacterium]